MDFNPHPPCGGWRRPSIFIDADKNFNPHPPCGGWHKTDLINLRKWRFQSTSSMRRMTELAQAVNEAIKISIHILHAEDDFIVFINANKTLISIHILHAEDDNKRKSIERCFIDFNPHPPCGGWQSCGKGFYVFTDISIHILHAEDDMAAVE